MEWLQILQRKLHFFCKSTNTSGYFSVESSAKEASVSHVKEMCKSKFPDLGTDINYLYKLQFGYGVSNRTFQGTLSQEKKNCLVDYSKKIS